MSFSHPDSIRRSPSKKEKALLVGLVTQELTTHEATEHLNELARLADTAGAIEVGRHLQHRDHPEPSSYIGKGKLQEITEDSAAKKCDLIIFDDELTGTQLRTIEKMTKRKVLDRTGLILDIFASRARTNAAKTQVELAQLRYILPRLTRFWTHLSRQSGGIGTKGPGETQIETDRRIIGQRIATLKETLKKIDKQRATRRKRRSSTMQVAIVGYTNAGKSTLLNALTHTDVLAEDRLFATLDSTVRRWELPNRTVLLSDTVGFIRKLPHHLVESFKSTLEEVKDADLLLHVVDASSPMTQEQIEAVESTLQELGASNTPVQWVFNKIDQATPEQLLECKQQYPQAVYVSAARHMGLDRLRQTVENRLEEDFLEFDLTLPITDFSVVSSLRTLAVIENECYDETSIQISGRTSADILKGLSKKYNGQLNVFDSEGRLQPMDEVHS